MKPDRNNYSSSNNNNNTTNNNNARPSPRTIPSTSTINSTLSGAKVKIAPNAMMDSGIMPNRLEEEVQDGDPTDMPSATTPKPSRPRPSRPNMSSRATSFAQSAKRASMGARSYSSFSLYANFAGEALDDSDDEGHYRHRMSNVAGPKITEEEKMEEVESEYLKKVPTASVGKAMFMFLKAFIGSGVLFLPKAFQNGGLALSIVLMIIISSICLLAFLRLVATQQVVGGSYADIGAKMRCQCPLQLPNQILEKYYIWFPLIILIPLSLIRHIARLSFCAILADILILFGLIVIIYFTSEQLHNVGVGPNVIAVNSMNFGMMIGTATFSFEGIGLLIPIVEAMEKPKKFPLVTTVGLIIVTVIYITIGTLSYLAYGDTIQAAVIYNFPPDNRLNIALELLYSAAIILTMPFMLFPALKIIENGLFYKFKSGRQSIGVKMSKNFYRVVISTVCAALAFGIGAENLDKFVSLVGSVACVPLCFILPGMFHLKIAKKAWDKAIDCCLMIWGTGILIYTLYVTINSFVHPAVAEATTPYCPA
ncbi:unnamed protein product [Absidia cylindrospora]